MKSINLIEKAVLQKTLQDGKNRNQLLLLLQKE
jgi:hypothetical protein